MWDNLRGDFCRRRNDGKLLASLEPNLVRAVATLQTCSLKRGPLPVRAALRKGDPAQKAGPPHPPAASLQLCTLRHLCKATGKA